jgi:hypothetical protein
VRQKGKEGRALVGDRGHISRHLKFLQLEYEWSRVAEQPGLEGLLSR